MSEPRTVDAAAAPGPLTGVCLRNRSLKPRRRLPRRLARHRVVQ